jgi:hypothetical protein
LPSGFTELFIKRKKKNSSMADVSLVNATLNTTGLVDPGVTSQAFAILLPEIFHRFFIFFAAPFIYPEMWWLLFHLLLTFVLFEFYFDRHDDEDLGWSAALANSIVAIFISMELLRAMYHHEGTPLSVLINVVQDYIASPLSDKSILITLVILLGGLGVFTATVNYFHLLPRKLAFLISGHKTINLLAYFLIVIVWRYTHEKPMPLDGATIIALFLFGIAMWYILFLINSKIGAKRKKSGGGKFDLFD